MVFPAIVYRCESRTINKAKHWRTNAFKLWYWQRLLRAPWIARSNQSVLKDINPEYSLEGLMMKLKLQYFDHLMWRANSLEKTLNLGKIWGQEEKGTTEDKMVGWHHPLNGHELEQTLGDSEGQGGLACCSQWGRKELHITQWLNNNKISLVT